MTTRLPNFAGPCAPPSSHPAYLCALVWAQRGCGPAPAQLRGTWCLQAPAPSSLTLRLQAKVDLEPSPLESPLSLGDGSGVGAGRETPGSSLVWEPGMNQRQPFSSVASSSAIHMPSTRPRGSVYRKEASWWGVTAQACPGVRSRSLCPVPPHRGRMSRSLVSWSPPGPASPRSVRNTLPGPGREGAPQGLGVLTLKWQGPHPASQGCRGDSTPGRAQDRARRWHGCQPAVPGGVHNS